MLRAARGSGITATIVGLQPTVIASRAPHLLLEQSVMKKKKKNHGRASPVNRSPIIFQNLQIKSKSVKEGMNRRIFSC